MSLLSQDYVVVKIDTEEMEHGSEVADQLRNGRQGGIPWMVILDADGNELINSDGPNGNIGCPIQPAEIDYFMTMLETTARHSDSEIRAAIRAALEDFAASYR